MSDEAYHDWLQIMAREKDMPADKLQWWIEQAIEHAGTFPHSLFKHCHGAEVILLAKYFPEAYEELQAAGAAMQAEFEAKHSYVGEWDRHQAQQLIEMHREQKTRVLRGDKAILAAEGNFV